MFKCFSILNFMHFTDIHCSGNTEISVREACNCDFELYVARMA